MWFLYRYSILLYWLQIKNLCFLKIDFIVFFYIVSNLKLADDTKEGTVPVMFPPIIHKYYSPEAASGGENWGRQTDRATKAQKTSRRVRGNAPRNILRSTVPEIPFSAFWGVIWHNYEMSYIYNTQLGENWRGRVLPPVPCGAATCIHHCY